jgi:hypothetical protein
MLTNYDIEKICDKLDLPLVGVFMKDELPSKRNVGSYIINMDSSDGDGTHWVFVKIFSDSDRFESSSDSSDSSDGNVHRYCGALYFDPFGIGMPLEIEKFLKPFGKQAINKKQIQNIQSTQCGWYCIYCDYFLETHKKGKSYLDDFRAFLEIWDDDPKKNLNLLKKFFKPL